MLAARADRVRARMAEVGVDVLLLSVGPDLPYLTGYTAMPLERLTMLVLPRDGDATLVVPRARGAAGGRAPRRVRRPPVGRDRRPGRPSSPTSSGAAGTAAIGDHTWARFVLDLQVALPAARFSKASDGHRTAPGREGAGARSRRCAGRRPRPTASRPSCRRAKIPLVGRTEAEVSADLGRRIVAEGHQHGELRHRGRRARTRPARTTRPAAG